MAALSPISRKIIKEVVSIPTAPFHEHKVVSYVARFCLKNGFRMRQDGGGNIFIRFRRGRARQPVVFTAHMDHPGFEVLNADKRCAEVGILGGVNIDYFRNANVVVSTDDGLVKGRVVSRTEKKWMGKPVFKIRTKKSIRKGGFGYYDLVGARFTKKLVYTKSADNLVGTAILLNLLLRLKKEKAAFDVTVVLTRAEEVGFVGCIYVADALSISKRVPIIVLETSDAVAGRVDINGGPVIRVGDKQSGFAPEVDAWMHMVALETQGKLKGFKFQRALLAGGRCEASAFILKGYNVGGLAFPLGNYHNNGDGRYATEFVGIDDYYLMLEFLLRLSTAPRMKEAFDKRKRELWSNFDKWKRAL